MAWKINDIIVKNWLIFIIVTIIISFNKVQCFGLYQIGFASMLASSISLSLLSNFSSGLSRNLIIYIRDIRVDGLLLLAGPMVLALAFVNS